MNKNQLKFIILLFLTFVLTGCKYEYHGCDPPDKGQNWVNYILAFSPLIVAAIGGFFGVRYIRYKSHIDEWNKIRERMASYLLRIEAYNKIPNADEAGERKIQQIRIDEERDEARANYAALLCILKSGNNKQGKFKKELIKHFDSMQNPNPPGLSRDSVNINLANEFYEIYHSQVYKKWYQIVFKIC